MNTRTQVTDRVTVYPRGKKKLYCAEFSYQGRHCRKSLKTTNLKQAKDLALDLDRELRTGTYSEQRDDLPLEDARERFLSQKQTEGRAPRTLTRYRGELERFCEFARSHRSTRLSQVTPHLIDKYRETRLKTRQITTVNHECEVVKQWLEWCVTRHHLTSNPLGRMKFRKPVREPQPALKLSQVQEILTAATSRLQFILATLALTGCRIGELQHLRREDVDLKNSWLFIVSRPGAETKTRRSRKLPLHPQLLSRLQKKPSSQGDWFFCAEPSERYPAGDHTITPKRINEEFQALLRRAGIPVGRKGRGYTLHSLRHFFETQCVNHGVPQVLVDRWMGHSTKRSMGATYYDDDEDKAREFMQRVPFVL